MFRSERRKQVLSTVVSKWNVISPVQTGGHGLTRSKPPFLTTSPNTSRENNSRKPEISPTAAKPDGTGKMETSSISSTQDDREDVEAESEDASIDSTCKEGRRSEACQQGAERQLMARGQSTLAEWKVLGKDYGTADSRLKEACKGVWTIMEELTAAVAMFGKWKEDAVRILDLPTGSLSRLTVVASQLSRCKVHLLEQLESMKEACECHFPSTMLAEINDLRQALDRAEEDIDKWAQVSHACEESCRKEMDELRVAVRWYHLAVRAKARRLRIAAMKKSLKARHVQSAWKEKHTRTKIQLASALRQITLLRGEGFKMPPNTSHSSPRDDGLDNLDSDDSTDSNFALAVLNMTAKISAAQSRTPRPATAPPGSVPTRKKRVSNPGTRHSPEPSLKPITPVPGPKFKQAYINALSSGLAARQGNGKLATDPGLPGSAEEAPDLYSNLRLDLGKLSAMDAEDLERLVLRSEERASGSGQAREEARPASARPWTGADGGGSGAFRPGAEAQGRGRRPMTASVVGGGRLWRLGSGLGGGSKLEGQSGRLSRTSSLSSGNGEGRPGSARLDKKPSSLMCTATVRASDRRQLAATPAGDDVALKAGPEKVGEGQEVYSATDRALLSAWGPDSSSKHMLNSSFGGTFGRLPSPTEAAAAEAAAARQLAADSRPPPAGGLPEGPSMLADDLVAPLSKEVYTQSEVIAFRVAQARQVQKLHSCYEERIRALEKRHQVQLDDLRQQIALLNTPPAEEETRPPLERTPIARTTSFAFLGL